MPNGTAGGSAIARCPIRAGKGLHEAVARTRSRRAGLARRAPPAAPLAGPRARAWPACSRLMSPPPLTKANKPPAPRRGQPERVARAARRTAAPSLPVAAAEPNTPDRGGRMESALAQLAGAADRDHRFVAGDDRLHQRLSTAVPRAAERKRRRYHGAAWDARSPGGSRHRARCHGRGAAEESGIEEVGAPCASRHWNTTGRARGRQHGFGAACNVATRARRS